MINKIEQLEQKIKDLDAKIAAYEDTKSDPYGRYHLTSRRRDAKRELTQLLTVGEPIYKIRDSETGLYSTGLINKYNSNANKKTAVAFNKKGKIWTSEKLVKVHLMKCITDAYGIPGNWEVVKLVEEPVKAMDEWVDAQMLMQILKHTGKNQK